MKGMPEFLDIVDEQNRVLGQDIRGQVHKQGLLHRGVHVLVFNSAGLMLLQKRSQHTKNAPGAYDLSVSEHVQSGEDFEEAAIRGLKEEPGIEGVVVERLLRFRLVYGPGDEKISELFKCSYDGPLSPDEGEVGSVEFLSLERVKEMVVGEAGSFSLWAREILRWYFGMESEVLAYLFS